MSIKKDQSDYETECAQLDLRARHLRAQHAASGKIISAPDTCGMDIIQRHAALTAHVAGLESGKASKTMTLTEQVLAAKGAHEAAYMAGSDSENRREVEDQRRDSGGRPADGDTTPADRRKTEDLKKSPHQVACETLAHVRETAYVVAPHTTPSVTSQVLAAKGVKSLAELNAKHIRRLNSGGED